MFVVGVNEGDATWKVAEGHVWPASVVLRYAVRRACYQLALALRKKTMEWVDGYAHGSELDGDLVEVPSH